MSLPASPPKYSSWADMMASIRVGETGWRAYAVQGVLKITADGIFGPHTLAAVKDFQRKHNLVVDGVVGPKTQAEMLRVCEEDVHGRKRYRALPDGVLRGFAEAEGAGLLAATNWSVAGGVDCGAVQRRVSGPPFSQKALRSAFGARRSLTYTARTILDRIHDFKRRRPSLTDRRALELAVLAHNWPAAADQFVRYGHLLSPDRTATWAPKPGGGYYTYAEWAEVYPARVLKHVK